MNTIRTQDDGSIDAEWDPTAVTDWDGVIFYPPLDVTRVQGAPVPSRTEVLDSDLTHLRWQAGLLALDTGIVACVGDDSPNYGLVVNHPDGGFTMFVPRDQEFVEGAMLGIRVAVEYMPRERSEAA
jgi:hypothetical protein